MAGNREIQVLNLRPHAFQKVLLDLTRRCYRATEGPRASFFSCAAGDTKSMHRCVASTYWGDEGRLGLKVGPGTCPIGIRCAAVAPSACSGYPVP